MTARKLWVTGFVLVAGWLAMGLGTCARAEALTVTGSARSAQLQQWADGSILPLPPTTIDVVDGGACPNQEWFVSCAYGDRSQVYLWVDANRRIWLHEVWHILEYQEFTDADRAAGFGANGTCRSAVAQQAPDADDRSDRVLRAGRL